MPSIPLGIRFAIRNIIADLTSRGYAAEVVKYEPSHFGNFVVDFRLPGLHSIRIVSDRSQLMLEGVRADLEPAGLYRTFSGEKDLLPVLQRYVTATLQRRSPDSSGG